MWFNQFYLLTLFQNCKFPVSLWFFQCLHGYQAKNFLNSSLASILRYQILYNFRDFANVLRVFYDDPAKIRGLGLSGHWKLWKIGKRWFGSSPFIHFTRRPSKLCANLQKLRLSCRIRLGSAGKLGAEEASQALHRTKPSASSHTGPNQHEESDKIWIFWKLIFSKIWTKNFKSAYIGFFVKFPLRNTP